MKPVFLFCLLGLSSLFAKDPSRTAKNQPTSKDTSQKVSRVYAGGYAGYGTINGMYSQDGQYTQYRLTLGVDAYYCKDWAFGFEGGVQSGNYSAIDFDDVLLAPSGGLYPEVILKPFLDALAVIRWNFVSDWSLIVKGGIAYRQLHFTDRTSPKDYLNTVAGEFQGGFGYQLTKHARLVGLYQGIYSQNSLGCYLDSNNDVLMKHIPTQQAGLFGVEYHF